MLLAAIARPEKAAALVGISTAADHLVTSFNSLPLEVGKYIIIAYGGFLVLHFKYFPKLVLLLFDCHRHARSFRRRGNGQYPPNIQRKVTTSLAWTFCARQKITVCSRVPFPSPAPFGLFMGSKTKMSPGTSPCRLQNVSSAPMWISSFGDMASTACPKRMISSLWSTLLMIS